ncbi:MAG: SpoIIE family protein phosphatase [Cyanobacteria bacterium]|nr:SpoIIE family protein phosphatase [Cyanobacteriota bacterium]
MNHEGYGWIPLFQEVDEVLLASLLSHCEVRRMGAGTDLLRPGEANESFYILLKGELMVYLSAEATQGQGIALQPGHCIGEFSAIDRLPVSALVRCESESELLHLSGPFFWQQLVTVPGVARNMMRGLTERARTTNQLALQSLRERLELDHLREEIDLARRLQASMLPLQDRLFQGRSDLDVAGRVEPAASVAGDFFDTFLTADDRLFLCIGDVSGHGIGASLLMARTIGLIRSLAMSATGPEAVLEQLNAFLCEGNDTCLFVTLFCGYLEPTLGTLTYSNAGHLPPLLIQGGECTALPLPRGLLAGISPQASYRSETVQLNRSDLLFAYTDGLSEAEDVKGRTFGIDPCRDLLIQRSQAPLPVILDGVRDALTSFCGSGALEDDCTLLLLRLP